MKKVQNIMIEKHNGNVKRTKNDILPTTFLFMKLFGLWQPFNLTILRIIYSVYSIFTIFTMLSVGLSLICLIITSENVEEAMVENSYFLFTLLNAWVKAAIILCRQRDIKSLLNTLLEDEWQPKDTIELDIQKKFDENDKKLIVTYSSIVATSVISMYGSVLMSDERAQALNTWRPYELNLQLYFWITWTHELIGHFVTAGVHVIGDSMMPGFINQISCQLQFLQHRLNNFPQQVQNMQHNFDAKIIDEFESSFIAKSVVHHNDLFRFGERIKNLFVEILFAQFVSSLIAICVIVYQISKEPLDLKNLLAFLPFLICMLLQLFLYCFYGNELMCNSRDLQEAIFETNWLFLGKETKKSLIIIMIRCKKPILISIGSIVFVNLNSFASILKTSYTAYNILQQSM